MSSALSDTEKVLIANSLRVRIEALRRELALLREGESRVEHARDLLTQDDDDAPQRSADREVEQARSERLVAELAAINATAERLNDPDYGRCVDCGAAIPFARLELEPTATRCVPCESRRERCQGAPHSATL